MAKAKAKSKSSKVAEKVEILKTPPKPKKTTNPIEEIVSALDEDDNIVFSKVRESEGDDLVKIKEKLLQMEVSLQQNYQVIIMEIDKY